MIVFFSNFINEHQIPLCEAFYKKTDGAFCFVATEAIWEERVKLGFRDQSSKYKYVLKSYESQENYNKACSLANKAEIVILGDSPLSFVEERLKANKITFKYSERFFKKGKIRMLDPRVLWGRYKQDIRFRHTPFYLLCAGAYVAEDARAIFSYPNKMYKWGYFPAVHHVEDINQYIEQKRKNTILWVGRFIDWKHPELPVKIAKSLKNDGFDFRMELIGNGQRLEDVKELIGKYDLNDCVHVLGAMPPERVREKMGTSEIFIFTSDRNEGWGVVLNEAMNAGCAIVASHAIGSVPFLVESEKNGMIYRDGNDKEAVECVKRLMNNAEIRKKIGKRAYLTIVEHWNAENAAERLIELANSLMKNEHNVKKFEYGVCSKADILKRNWFKTKKETE